MRSLLGLRDVDAGDIDRLLTRAQEMQEYPDDVQHLLSHTYVAHLFFENSTRTRFSFEVATKNLGAQVLHFQENVSSTQKGETFRDTLKTLEAMGVQAAVIRHAQNGILQEVSKGMDMRLINAGVGHEEHPTQALLDLLTMKQEFGHLRGLKVAIIGDLTHSRVLRSNVFALQKLGAHVLLAGPPNLKPEEEILSRCQCVTVDEAIQAADVVMMLRIQFERHSQTWSLGQEQYHQQYGLTVQRANRMQSHAIIMHPAPFNRDVEIASALVESPRSRIFKQVTNGVAVRMAVLERACTSTPSAEEHSKRIVKV
ncbi:aspartate carbamoyltransferase catalytic subunit [Caldalkalibacillus salinus]|uniref:aspartate carbamoyltransferase catalytic subunit n=1 Tax=Caldalkalibacillus salinus TaxID=2803787 RepID=UPI001924BD4B|nr:aspartate carbamoyltransferase catalytic subunit [Caldalkalibacillus salinus]